MKHILLTTLFLFANIAMAEETKTVTFDDRVVSIAMKDKDTYHLVLMGHAAQYWAKMKHFSCLDTSIKSRQAVKLTVDAFKLEVLDCQLSKK